MWNWIKRLFSPRLECLSCGDVYHKDTMKELWFRYTEDDGTTGTSSVLVCQPCLDEIRENIENGLTSNGDDAEFEVEFE